MLGKETCTFPQYARALAIGSQVTHEFYVYMNNQNQPHPKPVIK